MTDAHCHVAGPDASREFIIGVDFIGIHPWEILELGSVPNEKLVEISQRLAEDASLGVGEIGLDRMKVRQIPAYMHDAFISQLELAAYYRRPVVLHGAKCWGKVVDCCRPYSVVVPAFLFHGFSRSDGLLGDIAALNGFISVGPAVLNDHAVNYRELVKKIPADRLLIETDRTGESAAECPSVGEIARKVAELRGTTFEELEAMTDRNARRFRGDS